MPTAGKKPTKSLDLRITVVDPPAGILYALQLGKDKTVPPSTVAKGCITFDFTVDVVEGDTNSAFRLRGPAVQGRPGERFVYLRIGTYAGQKGTEVARRAKIGLEGITRNLIDAARAKRGARLEVRFAGPDSNGGAACATVPLLGNGWCVA